MVQGYNICIIALKGWICFNNFKFSYKIYLSPL